MSNIININIDLDEWVSVLTDLPKDDRRVDVILVNSTGQDIPIFICEDSYHMSTVHYTYSDWEIYNDYDCKVVYWKYKD